MESGAEWGRRTRHACKVDRQECLSYSDGRLTESPLRLGRRSRGETSNIGRSHAAQNACAEAHPMARATHASPLQFCGGSVILALLGLLFLTPLAFATEFVKGPYLQEMTAHSVTVMWESDKVAPAMVEYGPTGKLGRTILTRGRPALAGIPIDGLEADTVYYYRVAEGDAVSSTYTFRTLPEKGQFTFAVYGGPLRPKEQVKTLLVMALKNPSFVIHLGNIVSDGAAGKQWGPQFFDQAGPLMARVPFFTVAGEQEKESALYYNYLGGHGGRPWYSFDCADAHFVMLDSCVDLGTESEQCKWLVKDLGEKQARWKIVAMNQPIDYSQNDAQKALRGTLARCGADLVLGGRNGNREGEQSVTAAIGSAAVVSGLIEPDGTAPATDAVMSFCTVEIDGDKLTVREFNDDGRLLSGFAVTKDGTRAAGGSVANKNRRE